MEKAIWPIVRVVVVRLLPGLIVAGLGALVTAGLLDGQAVAACQAALGL